MAFYFFRGIKYITRLAAALSRPAIFSLFCALPAAAAPVMLFKADCRDADGQPRIFELQAQRLNPTAILMHFVLITPQRPGGNTLASSVISEGQMDNITFNRRFRMDGISGFHQMTFTTANLADIYIQKGEMAVHYQHCSLIGAAAPAKRTVPLVSVPAAEIYPPAPEPAARSRKRRGKAARARAAAQAKAAAAVKAAEAENAAKAAAANQPGGQSAAPAAAAAEAPKQGKSGAKICVSSTTDSGSSTYCRDYDRPAGAAANSEAPAPAGNQAAGQAPAKAPADNQADAPAQNSAPAPAGGAK